MIENNFVDSSIVINPKNGIINSSPVKITKIDTLPTTDDEKWNKTQLHTDSHGRYIHSLSDGTPTQFASYLLISPLTVNSVEVKKDGKNQ